MRRRKIWPDAVREFADHSLIDFLEKPLLVDFIGEDGGDYGGLTREFFTELFIGAEGHILQGPPEKLSILRNLRKLQNREYCVYGVAIGLALLHSFPGPRNLSTLVASYLLGQSIIAKPKHKVEIPDYELQAKLTQIMGHLMKSIVV